MTDLVRFYAFEAADKAPPAQLPWDPERPKTLQIETVVKESFVRSTGAEWGIEWEARRVALPENLEAAVLQNIEWVVLSDLPKEMQYKLRSRLGLRIHRLRAPDPMPYGYRHDHHDVDEWDKR